MVSYIGDDDDIIATYQDLAKEYSISQPEFWQSTETDMMFIVWGLVAILMIVLNMIEVIRRQKEVVVRASLGENAAVIALKAVVADMISYAALFVLALLLVWPQFISGATKIIPFYSALPCLRKYLPPLRSDFTQSN